MLATLKTTSIEGFPFPWRRSYESAEHRWMFVRLGDASPSRRTDQQRHVLRASASDALRECSDNFFSKLSYFEEIAAFHGPRLELPNVESLTDSPSGSPALFNCALL
jgi:hypothetical protein